MWHCWAMHAELPETVRALTALSEIPDRYADVFERPDVAVTEVDMHAKVD